MRIALGMGACFSGGAALLLLLPASLGQIAQLPQAGSVFYTWFLVMFVGLFGGAYAWLAVQAEIDRPLVVLAIIGKIGAFVVVLASWLIGEVSWLVVVFTSGDLLFVAVFAWWLQGELREAGALRQGDRVDLPADVSQGGD
jgi:hypothetical protein